MHAKHADGSAWFTGSGPHVGFPGAVSRNQAAGSAAGLLLSACSACIFFCICVKILPLRYCGRMVPESNQERAVGTSAQCGTGIIRPLHVIAMALICIRSVLAEASVKSAIYRRLNGNSPHAAVIWQISSTESHQRIK